MFFLRLLVIPFSLLYGGIIQLRNWFFDGNLLKETKVNAVVISLGNLSVGGTGKTPHVEYVAEYLSATKKTAILLRGYGRKSKGFLEVTQKSEVELVGDEALTYANRLGEKITIAVCEKRVEGANQLLENHPDLEVIILDDAYQHRYIQRDCNILLTEFQRPFFKDFVVPSGRLREFSKGKKRADMVVVTKSPENLFSPEKKKFIQRLQLSEKTPIFFSSIAYKGLIPISYEADIESVKKVLLVTGIGNPTPLVTHLKELYEVEHLPFRDHHPYTTEDIDKIHKLFDTFVSRKKIIVTTEKDAVRIMHSHLKNKIEDYPWYYQSMEIEIDDKNKFLKLLDSYVDTN